MRGTKNRSQLPSGDSEPSSATRRADEQAPGQLTPSANRNRNRKCAWRSERMENGTVVIRKRGADRIRHGHLWVYRSDIIDSRTTPPGAIAVVRDERGATVGKAFYSSTSQIALRFLARGDVPIHETFFRERFAAAGRLRERLGVDPSLSRRVYSEGD